MDREEAIELLEDVIGFIEDNQGRDYDTAFRMAIEALSAEQKEEELAKDIARQMATIIENEQDKRVILKNASAEPTDLISRADAIEAVKKSEHRITVADEKDGYGTVKWDMYGVYTAEAVDALKKLPSADKPSGEWEEMEIPCNPYPPVFCVECSECGYRVGRETYLENTFNYCPNCGAKMGSDVK